MYPCNINNMDYRLHSRIDRFAIVSTLRLRQARAFANRSKQKIRPFGGHHLKFKIDERTFIYSYIRKNACTTFKKFLLKKFCSPDYGEQEIKTLCRTLEVERIDESFDTAAQILVLRDPIERCCSLYKNKFIQQVGAEDIHKNLKHFTGISAADITFYKFVKNYLYAARNCYGHIDRSRFRIDPHCFAQVDHLWPIEYNCAFLMDDLSDVARKLFGRSIGEKFFTSRHNPSGHAGVGVSCSKVSAGKLTELYRVEGRLPTDEELLNSEISGMLRDFYASDFEIVAYVNAARQKYYRNCGEEGAS